MKIRQAIVQEKVLYPLIICFSKALAPIDQYIAPPHFRSAQLNPKPESCSKI